MRRQVVWLLLAVACVGLTGCGLTIPPDDTADLAAWMAEAAQPLKGRVKPLPAVRTVLPVAYQAEGLVEPFDLSRFVPAAESEAAETNDPGLPPPDLNRPREPLEAFALEDLKLHGVLERAGERWLLVAAPDGQLYLARLGNYLGRDYGRIEAITAEVDRGVTRWHVTVRERVRDDKGRWNEQVRKLTVAGAS